MSGGVSLTGLPQRLQLVLQYENFIAHSVVGGDQSKLISISFTIALIFKATVHGGNLAMS